MSKAYDDYKESGADWIGDIPKSWEISKLKWHLKRTEPRNPGGVQVLSLYRELGVIPKDSRDDNYNVTSEDTSNYKYVRPGDFVVNKMKAWQGSVAVSDYEGIVSPAYYVYHFTDSAYNKKYFHYLIRGCYKEEFMRLSGGIRIGQWDLPGDALNNIAVIIPPMEDQNAIAEYLTKKTEEIDYMIEEAENSISEYKLLKASIINEAIINGVWNHSEFKESGLELVERIPLTWKIARIKDVGNVQRGGSPRPIDDYITEDADGLNWIKIGDTVKGKKYITSVKLKIRKDGLSKTRMVHKGDLLLTNSMSFGEPYILDVDGCIHDGWVCISDLTELSKEFLYYFLCSDLCMMQFRLQVAGGVVQNLNVDKIGATKLFIPEIEEQDAIVKYLDNKCEYINSLIDEKELLVHDLESYKKATIFEVVTGKRKVV